MKTITLTISCNDEKGIIALITNFILTNNGNIVNLEQHTDNERKLFFMRLEWEQESFALTGDALHKNFTELFKSHPIKADFELHYSSPRPRMAIFVSKYDHCLYDLLLRHKSGEIPCDIPVIISNHLSAKNIAHYFEINFEHVPITRSTKHEAEQKELEILAYYNIDFIVLARYMQIITPKIINKYANKIINIHHSFLPAFKGARPYHQAYEKGVKIIGATAHFVTEELDQGPIIEQDIIHISHKDNVKTMVIKGRDIERQVLAKAVKLFLEHRIFVCENRTIIL